MMKLNRFSAILLQLFPQSSNLHSAICLNEPIMSKQRESPANKPAVTTGTEQLPVSKTRI